MSSRSIILIKGDDATLLSLEKNIDVKGNPEALWKWITADPRGKLNVISNSTQTFTTNRIKDTPYIAESTGKGTVQVFNSQQTQPHFG